MARKKKTRAGKAPNQGRGLRPQTVDASRWDRRRKSLVIAAGVLLLVIGGLLYALFGNPTFLTQKAPWSQPASAPTPKYVGAQACAACHKNEYDSWKGSHHALAMQHANAETVLGNFDGAKFSYTGVTSTFFKRDGKFFVNTDGPDGKLNDFEIKYAFGVTPLQQYLIEMPGFRFQALSIAWDSRPKEQGGQRWFHLYPKGRITHDEELHWTRPAQNWNFMCADCHSTGLRKNYDPATDRFKTEWSEINVGCEGCHGPGSNHVAWTKSESPPLKKRGKGGFESGEKISLDPPLPKGEGSPKGLTVSLDERRGVIWKQDETTGNAVRSQRRSTEREIDVCAQCHARRGQIADGYTPGRPFLDYYRPALLTGSLYHPDGQQHDEVYVWGSFLQSKMYASGVTCSDCHEPHSGKLRAGGNTVCASCHLDSKYDASAHHHHKSGSAGASCIACHMPPTTYMVVDPRHDHSLRVPRPDLSVKLGTPNACNGCHTNRDPGWAVGHVRQWYGRDPQGYQRFAANFSAADAGASDAQAQLRAVAADTSHSPIVRATALARFNAFSGRATVDAIAAGLRDGSPLVRLGALQSLGNTSSDTRLRLAAPLLSDPMKAIRIEATSVLASLPASQFNAEQRAAFERASAEFITSQKYNADRAEARVNLGTFYSNRGDRAKAEQEMKAAIGINPHFAPAYVNLADLYRVQSRDTEGERMLRDGLKILPKSAVLHHTLGLALVRLKRTNEALSELERATILQPSNARFSYVYAVALYSTGKADAAIGRLEKTLAAHPNNRDVLEALASYHAARGNSAKAKNYADRLDGLSVGDK
jgi:Tfp pilus assembly protein PilF